MGSVARVAALGSALAIAACAAIAGLDDPQTIDDATSAEGGSSSSSGSVQDTGNASSSGGSSSGTPTDGSSSGAPPDAAPDAPPCNMLKLGDTCQQSSQCCSTHCNEQRKCVNQCIASGDFCDPFSTSGCCVGFWCGGQCAPCRTAGQAAATEPIGGSPLAHSCCSRALQNGVGPNCL